MATGCPYVSPVDDWSCPEAATTVSGSCIFHDPDLNKDVNALKARFDARLTDKKEDPLRFDGAIFPGGTSFERVVFKRSISFYKAEFHGQETLFSGAKFHGQKTSFDFAEFRGQMTSFSGAEFHCRETSFYLAEFRGRETSFDLAVFHGRAIFKGMEPKAVFLGGEVDFRRMSLGERGELVFDWVDLSRSRFLHGDLSKVKFLDVTWDHPYKGIFKLGLWRCGLYDERRYREERRDKERRAAVDTDYLSHLGRLYRALKAYYRNTGEHHLVGHFHYGLMEAQWYQKGAQETERGLSWLERKWKGLVSWEAAYRFSSGYGEDYAWAGLMLVLVLLIFGGFYWFAAFYWGLGAPEVVKAPWWKQGLHSLLYSFQAGTLGRVSFYGFPSALRVRVLFLAESILVPVQFGFFILALRNRFRR